MAATRAAVVTRPSEILLFIVVLDSSMKRRLVRPPLVTCVDALDRVPHSTSHLGSRFPPLDETPTAT
jgi:hypothetical protein